jgi:osmotically inducible protein OsmC
MTARNGSAEWHGDVQSGSGTVTVGNGVFEGAYSYGSRFGEDEGTNPEQLIAAAHAGCFTMALSSILSAAGQAPESLRTKARVRLRNVDGAPALARIDLDVQGHVAGVDEQQFQRYADEAKTICPVSRALAGVPEIVVIAKLASVSGLAGTGARPGPPNNTTVTSRRG